MIRKTVIFMAMYCFSIFSTACYSQINCGPPPSLPMESEDIETTKAGIVASVQTIIRSIGGGNVETIIDRERRRIYQSADKIAAAQQDAYMLYMVCSSISRDVNISAMQAIDLLAKFRKPPPITQIERPRTQCLTTYTKIPYTCPKGQIGYVAVCTSHNCDNSNNGNGSTKVDKNVQCNPLEKRAVITYKACPTDRLGFVQSVFYPNKCKPNKFGGQDCIKRTVNTSYCISIDEAKRVSRPEEPIAFN